MIMMSETQEDEVQIELPDDMPLVLQSVIDQCIHNKSLWRRIAAASGHKYDLVFLVNNHAVLRALVQEKP